MSSYLFIYVGFTRVDKSVGTDRDKYGVQLTIIKGETRERCKSSSSRATLLHYAGCRQKDTAVVLRARLYKHIDGGGQR